MLYKGWVPTVTGKLSFTTFGDTDYPSRYDRFGNPNLFLISQNRALLDSSLPLPFVGRLASRIKEFFSFYLFGISGDFKFILTGSFREADNVLVGRIIMLPDRILGDKREKLRIKFAKLNRGIHRYDIEDIEDFVEDIAIGDASFVLKRSGEILIRTGLETAIADHRNFDFLVANQMYYLLKDCFHIHQHHEPSHDAIINLCVVDSDLDQSWVKKTQQRLYRQIIRYKRFRDQKTLFRASGILAYTQSFEKNFEQTGQIESFRVDELERSLAVRREEIQHFDQLRLNKQQSFMTWFFSITAFVLSAAVLAQLDKTFNMPITPVIKAITTFFATYPIPVLGLVWIVSKTMQMFAFRDRPHEWPFIRGIYQMLRGGTLDRFVLVLGLISVTLAALSIRIVSVIVWGN